MAVGKQNILYSFRRCPYAMRARMGLRVSDIEYEHREILLRDKPAEMLEASPKGSVPVFIRKDGKVIDESFDILLWALGQNDPKNWLAPDMDEMMGLIKTIEDTFIDHLNRYKYASRYDKSRARNNVDLTHRAQACEILVEYENRLAKSAFLMGEAPSLVDYAIFPFIRQFAAVERDWWDAPQFPHLHTWLEHFIDTQIFRDIMHKYPLFVSEVAKAEQEVKPAFS